MDGNKEDALKCLKICKNAMEAGDRPRALKFLAKARRLDPNLPIDDLVSELNNKSDETGSAKPPGSAATAKDSSDRPSLRQRGSSTTSSSSSSISYTEEQISIVRKIKSKKDYYEILGLESNCSVDDVRKAYRKLSLKVHPDKNPAPGSEEAFKSVSKAFQCLSNEDARKKYDVSGSDEPIYQPRGSARSNGFNGGGYYYEDEFDPNEIFRAFFGGGGFGGGGMPPAATQFRSFNFGATRQRAANNNNQAPEAGFNGRILLQLLPVIFILLLNFLPSSQPVYSLSATYPYHYKFTTQRGVNYFVRSSKFEQDYPRDSNDRHVLEEQVERDYVSILSQNCRYEMQRKQWGFVRETPHCDMMRRFETAEG
ncbi:PREDICTED: chaperone protein dnaJ 49-like [Camelina sativa]|uniref:Chaperone protein dnaJ 49-like n=1 Tax=Camelina sativa TaxID=90675 RepID=A0ABM0YR30_CAMSA|nr:PREDICTED: chaperone protein dnaJ 49-like [Camelina sativa]